MSKCVVNIDEPRWDQSTYLGRAKYYFATVNPLNLFYSAKYLDCTKTVIDKYRRERQMPEGMTVEQLYKLKDIYDSAFHPETGEKLILVGRMSAQVPMNMLITGCMMTFYRSNKQVIFWQWINQSFNAIVNYSNRSGVAHTSNTQLGAAYVCATTGAVITALGCKSLVQVIVRNPNFLNKLSRLRPFSSSPPERKCHELRIPDQKTTLLARFVPFFGVVAANCVNIPIMRYQELKDGIAVYTENNNLVGKSQVAARSAIAAVVFSRIVMAFPSMSMTPVIMHRLERKPFLKKNPVFVGPVSILLTGFILLFATPLACAIFSQKAWMPVEKLEHHLQEETKCKSSKVYYNKGL